MCLSDLLTALRQESSEDALKTTMDQTGSCLHTFTHRYPHSLEQSPGTNSLCQAHPLYPHLCVCVCVCYSYRQCVFDQYQLLDLLPSLHVEEFVSYSNNLTSFFRVGPPSTLVTMETQSSFTHTSAVTRVSSQ